MDGYLRISTAEYKRLLHSLHHAPSATERLRWNALLLLADGHTWNHITTVLYCSSATIARWKRRYEEQGRDGIAPMATMITLYWWVARIVNWVQSYTPLHFGYLRSRWTCSTLVLLLAREYQVNVSRETVRRYLHHSQVVWRRPRPILRPKDPDYDTKVLKIKRLLNSLPGKASISVALKRIVKRSSSILADTILPEKTHSTKVRFLESPTKRNGRITTIRRRNITPNASSGVIWKMWERRKTTVSTWLSQAKKCPCTAEPATYPTHSYCPTSRR